MYEAAGAAADPQGEGPGGEPTDGPTGPAGPDQGDVIDAEFEAEEK